MRLGSLLTVPPNLRTIFLVSNAGFENDSSTGLIMTDAAAFEARRSKIKLNVLEIPVGRSDTLLQNAEVAEYGRHTAC